VLEVLTHMCVVSAVQWLIFLQELGNLISISNDVGSSTLASHLGCLSACWVRLFLNETSGG